MKILSTEGLTKLIQLIKNSFISIDDTVTTTTVELADVATTGDYNDLTNKPTIPAAQVQSDWNVTNTSSMAYIKNKPTIPSVVTESTVSGWGFTKNAGTITGITMNGSSKGTSGVVDLGTVITAHQDISGKVDKTSIVSTVSPSSTNSQVVGAKLFYDTVGDIETLLQGV